MARSRSAWGARTRRSFCASTPRRWARWKPRSAPRPPESSRQGSRRAPRRVRSHSTTARPSSRAPRRRMAMERGDTPLGGNGNGVGPGNGNRALWGPITILDGAIYRLPNNELVQASVVPHPEALPQYWEAVPAGQARTDHHEHAGSHTSTGDSWPRGEGLILSVLWHAEGSARGSIGPALLRFLNAAAVAGVPWGSGYSVSDLDVEPGLLRDTVHDDYDTGWHLEQLAEAGPDAQAEFAEAVRLARAGTQR